MIKDYRLIKDAAAHISGAIDRTILSLRDSWVEQEPHFTDRMLGRIEEAMSQYEHKGVRWAAKTLTDRGANSQEKQYGADFMVVLSMELMNYSVKKGFLAQAKLVEPGEYFKPSEFERLQGQCSSMLEITPESFIFLYSRKNVTVVPASSVVNAKRINPHDLYSRSVTRFFEDHFSCFVGDQKISTQDLRFLDRLREAYRSRSLLYLSANELSFGREI